MRFIVILSVYVGESEDQIKHRPADLPANLPLYTSRNVNLLTVQESRATWGRSWEGWRRDGMGRNGIV